MDRFYPDPDPPQPLRRVSPGRFPAPVVPPNRRALDWWTYWEPDWEPPAAARLAATPAGAQPSTQVFIGRRVPRLDWFVTEPEPEPAQGGRQAVGILQKPAGGRHHREGRSWFG